MTTPAQSIPAELASAIAKIREAMTTPENKKEKHRLYSAVTSLSRLSHEIARSPASLAAVLALAPEIKAYRGKGAQDAAHNFALVLASLPRDIMERLPLSEDDPDHFLQEHEIPESARDVVECLDMLAAHAFAETKGPTARSRLTVKLRVFAWETLELISEILRRPAHLAHAFEVAENPRASSEERGAALGFLVTNCGDDPGPELVALLDRLLKSPPDREFLITVLQARIDLGLDDELGALAIAGDWDDEYEPE